MDEYDVLEDAAALIAACDALPLDFALGGVVSPLTSQSDDDGAASADTNDSDATPSAEAGGATSATRALPPRRREQTGARAVVRGKTKRAVHQPLQVPGDGKTAVKNQSRERLKSELVFLRDRVVALERELNSLRRTQEEVVVAKTAAQRTTAIAPVWRRICERQLTRRSRSETENERLRRALDAQIRVAKSLEHMLRKRSSAAMVDLFAGAREPSRTRIPSANGQDLHALCAQFFGDIDNAYLAVDHVYNSNGLARIYDETIRGYQVKTHPVNGQEQVYIELQDVKIVPFAYDRARRVIWRAVLSEFTRRNRMVPTSEYPANGYVDVAAAQEGGHEEDGRNQFVARFQCRSHSRTREGVLNVTFVMKRFLEAERMVLVWRATNAAGEGEDVDDDWRHLFTDETGWIVVKCVSDLQTVAMQSCVHIVPRWFNAFAPDVRLDEVRTGDFTKLVINAYEDDAIAISEAVENLLIDESVAARPGGI